jgi:uncharacterized RDD family membrane protein YckC/RNA polymerase subunit RPABC4/transcription elongation factor Spt4
MNMKLCERCGERVTENFRKCPSCGLSFHSSSSRSHKILIDNNRPDHSKSIYQIKPTEIDMDGQNKTSIHADFFQRGCACVVDWIIVLTAAAVPMTFHSVIEKISKKGLVLTLIGEIALYVSLAILIGYSTILHASEKQSTIGKRLFGLKLSMESGEKITFGKALERSLITAILNSILAFLATIIFFGIRIIDNTGSKEYDPYSYLFFAATMCLLPFGSALFGKRKMTLYDYICKTRVIKESQ